MKYLRLISYLVFIDILIKDKVEKDFYKLETYWNKQKIKKYISLSKHHNYGFPFGKLSKFKNLVKYLPSFITTMLSIRLFKLIKLNKEVYKIISLSLIIAGSISNIRDRFSYGYVVDYFSFKFDKLKNIVLNLGDIYIFIGSILYTIGGIIFG